MSWMSERRIRIKLPGYLGDTRVVRDILPQGSPLSALLYVYYNSDLVEATMRVGSRGNTGTGYVDDVNVLVRNSTIEQNIKDLSIFVPLAKAWAVSHSSTFEVEKFKLIHFVSPNWKNVRDQMMSFTIDNHTIDPSETVKVLGLQLHNRLDPIPQIKYASKKALKAWMAISRHSNRSNGLTYSNLRKLYNSTVVPRLTYMCSIWFKPTMGLKRLEPLIKVQRLAMTRITGCLRNTSLDATEVEADILPIYLILDQTAKLIIARLNTRSFPNPISKIINTTKHGPGSYRTPFQIFHPQVKMEKILPIHIPPWSIANFKVDIGASKDIALSQHIVRPREEAVTIYTDGSRTKDGVGAAAFCIGTNATESRGMGQTKAQNIFPAELMGINLGCILAIRALETMRVGEVTIYCDSQATLKSLLNPFETKSSRSVLTNTFDRLQSIGEQHPDVTVNLIWCPGHKGILGNEIVDGAAKSATHLPPEGGDITCLSSLKEYIKKQTREKWTFRWQNHNTARHRKQYCKLLLRRADRKILETLSKKQSSLLLQFRNGHVPLNYYLHRIRSQGSAKCPHCDKKETITHFIYQCSHYQSERQILRSMTKNNYLNRKYLFFTEAGIWNILTYITQTGRFTSLNHQST
jgi:ribonuclease HI